jgi:hypothetical protein
MAQIYTAFASEVKVNEETLAGLQAIEYQVIKNRQHVGAIGTDERIAVYFGLRIVIGKLRVASASVKLDDLLQKNEEFSISATLKHGSTQRQITFDQCFVEEKTFGMTSATHGETIYSFTATSVTEV